MEPKRAYAARALRVSGKWTVSVPELPDAMCIADSLEDAQIQISEVVARVTGAGMDTFHVAVFPETSASEARQKAIEIVTAALVEIIANDEDPIEAGPDEFRQQATRMQGRFMRLDETMTDEVGRWQVVSELAGLASALIRTLSQSNEQDPLEMIQEIRDTWGAEGSG